MHLYVSLCYGVVIPATHHAHKRLRDLVGTEPDLGVEVTHHGELRDRGLVAFVQTTHTSLTSESDAGVVRLRAATNTELEAITAWCAHHRLMLTPEWVLVRSVG